VPPSETTAQPFGLSPKLALRIGVLGMLALGVFAVLFLRLWALQVLSGTQYLRTAQDNQLRTVRIDAPRGPILDRNGHVLVMNVAGTAIQIWPTDLPKDARIRSGELRRLARIVHVPLGQILAGIRKRRGDPLTPVTVKESARDAQVAFLYEHGQDFPGITVAETYLRHYPYRSLAGQILGYVGEISATQLKHARKRLYRAGDDVGQTGVEFAYDTYLRGVPGEAKLRVDSLGHPRSALTPVTSPQPGNTLRLTIDLGLQRAAERALFSGIANARAQGHWAANGGAVVAMDPRDGSILALASAPSFDPSVYSGRVTTRELAAAGLTQRTAREHDYPGLDRATEGMYPAGSTFKPVTALAALEEHVVSPYEAIPCTGSYEKAGQTFKNWDPFVSEQMTLPTALAASCDTYFYELGWRFYKLPRDRRHPLQEWAAKFGFGTRSGVDVGPEASGLLPTPEWRQRTYTRRTDRCCWQVDRLWKPGDSIQLAIGQKDLLVTPLQMTRFYALIANGGRLVAPHVLRDVEQPGSNGTPARVLPVRAFPAPQPTNVDSQALDVVRQGLLYATHATDGTSSAIFGSFPVSIAGKTGTAEKVVDIPGYRGLMDQSWWCGYGPAEDPRIVVCVLIENGGHGGTAAAPAALQVFEQYFHVHAGQQGTVYSD
jgi:penicillin-binding protein 2